jgi:hypothetical protein
LWLLELGRRQEALVKAVKETRGFEAAVGVARKLARRTD